MGIETILGGASIVSGLFGAGSAKKAAKAQEKAADAQVKLAQGIYEDTSAKLQPYVTAGTNALDAYLYELGLGPRPTYGGSTPTVEVVKGGGSGAPMGNPALNVTPDMKRMYGSEAGMYAVQDAIRAKGASSGPDRYRVGSEMFNTAAEAEAYAKSKATPGTPYGGYEVSPMAKYLLNDGMEAIDGSAAAAGNLYSGATLKKLEDNRRELITADTTDYFNRLLGISDRGQSAAAGQGAAGQNYVSQAGTARLYGSNAAANGYLGAGQAIQGSINDLSAIYGYFSDPAEKNPMAAYAGNVNRPKANPMYAA